MRGEAKMDGEGEGEWADDRGGQGLGEGTLPRWGPEGKQRVKGSHRGREGNLSGKVAGKGKAVGPAATGGGKGKPCGEEGMVCTGQVRGGHGDGKGTELRERG